MPRESQSRTATKGRARLSIRRSARNSIQKQHALKAIQEGQLQSESPHQGGFETANRLVSELESAADSDSDSLMSNAEVRKSSP